MLDFLPGGKTIGLGLFLVAYVVVQYLNKEPLEQEILYGVLGAMGITLRMGVARAEAASKEATNGGGTTVNGNGIPVTPKRDSE